MKTNVRKATSKLVRKTQVHRDKRRDVLDEEAFGRAKAAEREWRGNPR